MEAVQMTSNDAVKTTLKVALEISVWLSSYNVPSFILKDRFYFCDINSLVVGLTSLAMLWESFVETMNWKSGGCLEGL